MNSILICYVVVCLGYAGKVFGQDQPIITEIIWPEIKKLGMTGYLNCTVIRQGTNKLNWIRNSDQTVLTNDDRVQVDNVINEIVDGQTKFDVMKKESGDRTTYTLVIRRLVMSDAGNYTCQVRVTGAALNPMKVGQMVVLYAPVIVQALSTLSVTINEGESVNLTCAAMGYPTPNITWVRSSGNALPAVFGRFLWVGSVLPLTNLESADRGMYRCIANNNIMPVAYKDTSVYVNVAPSAHFLQSTYGQAANRQLDLTIYCIVEGYPAPEFRFYQVIGDGLRRVIEDDRHTIRQVLAYGQQVMEVWYHQSIIWYEITFINILANDYGYYVCQGTNKLGTGQATVQIYETSECQGPNCPLEGGQVHPMSATGSHVPLSTVLSTAVLSLCLHGLFQI